MEQFKIDVSKCTNEEKRRIQERLTDMGYPGLEWIQSSTCATVNFLFAKADGFGVWASEDDIEYSERPASDFLTRFQTRPHDYTGCHPDIAAALKRGEDILCEHNNGEGWIFAYDAADGNYCYTNERNDYYEWEPMALPIPAKPAKKAVTLELTDEQLTKIKEMIDEMD